MLGAPETAGNYLVNLRCSQDLSFAEILASLENAEAVAGMPAGKLFAGRFSNQLTPLDSQRR